MRRALALALLFVLVGAAWLGASAEDEPKVAAVTWHTDLEAARTKAHDEGRPLMVVFQ